MSALNRPGSVGRVLVVGGSSGIGAAVASRLVAEGSEVVNLDRVPGGPDGVRHVRVDLADPSSIDAALAAAGDGWDAVCHVAGIPGTASDLDVFKVNYLGMRHLTAAALPLINPHGALVIVASTAGSQWPLHLPLLLGLAAIDDFDDGLRWWVEHAEQLPTLLASAASASLTYNFTKEASIVYAMRLAFDAWTRSSVRVNTVSPGPVHTPILADFEESMGKQLLDGVAAAFGRHATPSEVAAAVVWLAGPDAAWINGVDLRTDAGLVAALTSGAIPVPA